MREVTVHTEPEVRKEKMKLRNEGVQKCHLAGTWEVA